MTPDDFDLFCGGLPASSRVVQWGGARVWKAGGKMFAIGGRAADTPAYTFKVSPIAFEVLRDSPGLRPAPYLASRGLSWIQHFSAPGLSDEDLRDHIRESHRLVARGSWLVAVGLRP